MDGYEPNLDGTITVHNGFEVTLCYSQIEALGLTEAQYITDIIMPLYYEQAQLLNDEYIANYVPPPSPSTEPEVSTSSDSDESSDSENEDIPEYVEYLGYTLKTENYNECFKHIDNYYSSEHSYH